MHKRGAFLAATRILPLSLALCAAYTPPPTPAVALLARAGRAPHRGKSRDRPRGGLSLRGGIGGGEFERRSFLQGASSSALGAAGAAPRGSAEAGIKMQGGGGPPKFANLLLLADEKGDASLKELERLPEGAKVVARGTTFEELEGQKDALATVNVVLVSHVLGVSMSSLLSQLWPLLPKLEWIYARSAGVDHLICKEMIADKDRVTFTNARGVFSHSLAEYTMLAIGYFSKDLARWERNKAAKSWDRYLVKDIKGSTLGIVGYGDIGRACARLAKAYGMKVVAVRRRPEVADEEGLVDACYGPDKVNDLMAVSDYVVCAAPLTPSTKGMISTKELAAAKLGSVLINVGRGAVIDEDALIDALRSGDRLRGAALDVFTTEPLPEDSPLWTLDNLLLSPHNADQTADFLNKAVAQFVDESMPAFLKGDKPLNSVDVTNGY